MQLLLVALSPSISLLRVIACLPVAIILIYILKDIVKDFIKDFYKGITQGYNRVTALVNRL